MRSTLKLLAARSLMKGTGLESRVRRQAFQSSAFLGRSLKAQFSLYKCFLKFWVNSIILVSHLAVKVNKKKNQKPKAQFCLINQPCFRQCKCLERSSHSRCILTAASSLPMTAPETRRPAETMKATQTHGDVLVIQQQGQSFPHEVLSLLLRAAGTSKWRPLGLKNNYFESSGQEDYFRNIVKWCPTTTTTKNAFAFELGL